MRRKFKVVPIILWMLSIASIFLALKTCGDPIPIVVQNAIPAHLLQQFSTGNTLIFNLSVGFLVSVIFYLLIVYYPQRRKKNLIKRSIEECYKHFKKDTITILLFALENSCDGDLPSKLSDQESFKEYFKTQVNGSQTRWEVVVSRLDESSLRDLSIELEILMNEVEFVLNNVTMDDGSAFLFLKRLCQAVYKLKNSTLGGNDLKELAQFLWGLFAGFSFVDGYRKSDIIKDMIDRI